MAAGKAAEGAAQEEAGEDDPSPPKDQHMGGNDDGDPTDEEEDSGPDSSQPDSSSDSDSGEGESEEEKKGDRVGGKRRRSDEGGGKRTPQGERVRPPPLTPGKLVRAVDKNSKKVGDELEKVAAEQGALEASMAANKGVKELLVTAKSERARLEAEALACVVGDVSEDEEGQVPDDDPLTELMVEMWPSEASSAKLWSASSEEIETFTAKAKQHHGMSSLRYDAGRRPAALTRGGGGRGGGRGDTGRGRGRGRGSEDSYPPSFVGYFRGPLRATKKRRDRFITGKGQVFAGCRMTIGGQLFDILAERRIPPGCHESIQVMARFPGTNVSLFQAEPIIIKHVAGHVATVVATWTGFDRGDGATHFGTLVEPARDGADEVPAIDRMPKSLKIGSRTVIFDCRLWKCEECQKWVDERKSRGVGHSTDAKVPQRHTIHQLGECKLARDKAKAETQTATV